MVMTKVEPNLSRVYILLDEAFSYMEADCSQCKTQATEQKLFL